MITSRLCSLTYCVLGVLIIYFYIYAPPFQFLPFGTDKPFFLFSLLYLSYHKSWMQLYVIFQREWILLISIFLFSLFVCLLHREDYGLCLYDFLLLLECLPCSYTIYLLGCKAKIGTLRLNDFIIISAIIGGIISTFLLLNPEYTYYIKTSLLKYPEHLVDKFLYRGYGISDGLLFSYPVIQGFCFAFILVNVGGKNIWYKFSLLLLFVSIISNARSGFVPIAITVLLLFRFRFLLLFKYVLAFFLLSLIFAGVMSTLIENNEMLQAATEWSKTSVDIIGDFFSGEKSENVESLLGDMVVWPKTVDEWLVGSGRNLFGDETTPTDIGYFIRLNYGGFFYLILWAILWLFMFFRLHKANRGIALIMFISLIYLNYKGDFFVVNPGSRFFFFFYVLIVLNHSLFCNSLNLNMIHK